MQFGAYTFVETRRDSATGEPVDVDKAFAQVIEQIELADRVGLDVFGLGEHHRPDYAVSAPAVALAAAAARTKRIRLTSAVTVLSSDDPVRVYQQFATLDLISGGRAEIMAGRGSFIEFFPLFGYNLNDYDALFAEKLDLLLQIRDQPNVTWQGLHRAPLKGQGVYPRAQQQPLPVWIASGGTPQSVARAGALGLPLAIAIIGGEPARFAPLAELYREAGRRAGVAPDKLLVGINGHGFLADTAEAAKQIEKWRPDPARTLEMVDGAVPGLRVQLSPFGDLTWSLSAYVHGVRRRIALGKGVRLAEARRKAEQMRAEIANGVDPTATRKAHAERHRDAAKGVGTLGSVITAYYEGPGAHLRTRHEMRVMLERVFKPHLSSPSLNVKPADLQRTIDSYPSKSSAQHAAIYFRQVARWAAKRDLLPKMEPLETPRVLVQRHKLTPEQVGKLWRELGWTRHALAARFMLLTATRREEVCGATWREFDLAAGECDHPCRTTEEPTTGWATRKAVARCAVVPAGERVVGTDRAGRT